MAKPGETLVSLSDSEEEREIAPSFGVEKCAEGGASRVPVASTVADSSDIKEEVDGTPEAEIAGRASVAPEPAERPSVKVETCHAADADDGREPSAAAAAGSAASKVEAVAGGAGSSATVQLPTGAAPARPPIDEANVARAAAYFVRQGGGGDRDPKRGRENIVRSPMAYLQKAVATARKLFVRWVTLTDDERREEAAKGGGPYVLASLSAPWIPAGIDDLRWVQRDDLSEQQAEEASLAYLIGQFTESDHRRALISLGALEAGSTTYRGLKLSAFPRQPSGAIAWGLIPDPDGLTGTQRAQEVALGVFGTADVGVLSSMEGFQSFVALRARAQERNRTFHEAAARARRAYRWAEPVAAGGGGQPRNRVPVAAAPESHLPAATHGSTEATPTEPRWKRSRSSWWEDRGSSSSSWHGGSQWSWSAWDKQGGGGRWPQ